MKQNLRIRKSRVKDVAVDYDDGRVLLRCLSQGQSAMMSLFGAIHAI